MKKNIIYLLAGAAIVFGASCKKYLDINANPNDVIASTPDLVMPQALVTTGTITHSNYNVGIGRDLMYDANAGGFSGFGVTISYDYTPASFTAAWANTYDNLEDYKYIKDQTAGNAKYVYFNAISRIMSSYLWGMLVDQYDNIPYTEALQGTAIITPKYDKGTDVYKSIAAQLDTAIIMINSGLANPLTTTQLLKGSDPLFTQQGANGPDGNNMLLWKKFANTVKLRLMVRAGSKVTFANTTFSSDGFLTTDVLVNPDFQLATGKVSPMWLYNQANALLSSSSRIPSTYSAAFYNGTKLSDTKRGSALYKTFPPATNQLGNETAPNPPSSPTPNAYFRGTSAAAGYDKAGIYKGPTAGVPIITAAESYFLQAEAVVRGYITGNAATLFDKGIEASYIYLYKDATGAIPATGQYSTPTQDAAAYHTANPASYLVDFTLALTPEQKIEAIITQKYIALNQISAHESWNDYRRTGYPVSTGTAATTSLASTVSLSTRPDRMPTRFPYPSTEVNANVGNIPAGVDKFATLMFWAK